MATYLFTTPTVDETPAGWNILFERVSIPRGVSVLRINGVYSSYRYPAQTIINQASEVYLGGHVYEIDEDAKDRLTAAGYGEYITEV